MPHQLLASGFLGLLVGAVAVGLAAVWIRTRSWRHGQFTRPQAILLLIAWLLVRLLWRATLPRHFPAPAGRGAVIVSNHRSSVDPFFIQAAVRRPIHWMVAKEYCEHPLLRWFLRTCEVIPVSRGGVDTAATKAAMRLVSAGGIVGMFPEGRINMTNQLLLPIRGGAALIAQKARVPIVPCLIVGSPYADAPWSPFLMPARAHLRFGEPIEPPADGDGDERQEGVAPHILRVARAIAALAGQPDFEPKLAGRRWKPTEDELAAHRAQRRRG